MKGMVERLKICHKNSFKKSCGSRDQKQLMKIGTLLQHAILHQNRLYQSVCTVQKDELVLGLKGSLLNNVLKKPHIVLYNHFTIEA